MELAIISCLLQDPTLHGKVDLDEKDFVDYPDIFAKMQEFIEGGKNPDLVLMGKFISTEVIEYLSTSHFSTSFFLDYVKEFKDQVAKRNIKIVGKLIQENPDPREAQILIDKVLKRMKTVSGAMKGSELAEFYREQLKDTSQNSPISSGFRTFDRMSGLYTGEITTLAALTSIGKSAIGMNIALNAAQDGRKVLFVSSEMTTRRLLDRIYAKFSSTDNTVFKKGEPTEDKIKLGEDALNNLDHCFKLKQLSQCTSEDIISLAIREEIKDGLDLLVIDHLHSLHDEIQKGETNAGKYSRMMARFQDIATSLECSVLVLAQFNREGYKGKRPTISDLKESSAIEQFSTNVVVLHRDNRDSTDAELYIDKARNGEIGVLALKFEKKITTFYEQSTIDKNLNS